MKKKKLLAGLLIASAALGLAACGGKNDETDNPDDGNQEVQKTLASISVSGAKTEFNVGDTFDKGSLVVTAKYSDNTTAVVTSSATVDSSLVNMDTAGTYTVKVTYQGKEASYTITVTAVQNVATLKAISVETLNATTTYEVGDTISYDGVALELTYSNTVGGDTTETVTDLTGYTIEVKDANNAAVTEAFAEAGTYIVTISKDGISGSYEVTVTKKQVLVSLEYNTNGITPLEEKQDVLLTTGTVLYDSYGTKLAVGPADGGKVKQQVYTVPGEGGETTVKEYNGVTYNGRVQLGGSGSSSKVCLVLTTTDACKVEIVALASGSSGERPLTMSNGQAFITTLEAQTYTFDVAAAGDYYIYSGNSGINLYDIKVTYSYDEDLVTENDAMAIAGYATEFTTTGDTQFDIANPKGLVVTSYNNKGGATVLSASDYTITLKDSTDTAVTEITTPGTYKVVVTVNGTALSQEYEITVTNPNATIESVAVTTSNATVKEFYGDDVLSALGLTVVATDSDSLSKTLEDTDYTVALLKDSVEVSGFTTTGEYEVQVSYGGKSATYTINYYALGSKVIITDQVSTTIAIGATEFENKAYAVQQYEDNGDDTDVKLDDVVVSYALYSDVECLNAYASAEEAFATAGTVYAKFSAENCTDVIISLTVKEITSMTYSYSDTETDWTIVGNNGSCKIGLTDMSFASSNTDVSLVKIMSTSSETEPTAYLQSALIGDGTSTSVTVNILMGSTKTSNNITMIVQALDADGNVIGSSTCYSVKGYKPEGGSSTEKVTAYCTTEEVTASAAGNPGETDITVSVDSANEGKTISYIRILSTEGAPDYHYAIVSVDVMW